MTVVNLLLLFLLAAVAVIYALATNTSIGMLRAEVEALKTAPLQMQPSPRSTAARGPARVDTIVQRRDPPAVTAVNTMLASNEPLVTSRPSWASELSPRYLQFETPLDDSTIRLPARGGFKGLADALANGFRVVCLFGVNGVQPTPAQLECKLMVNDETTDEYALITVPAAAFRGRNCTLAWMGE